MTTRQTPIWRSYTLPATLTLLSIVIAAVGDTLQLPLRYDRDAIMGGQLWRLVSAHLTHLGWSHLGLNLAGLAMVFVFFGSLLTQRHWLTITLVCAVGTSVGLFVFNPDVKWYVGLSGVLHGLFIAGGIADLKTRRNEALVFLGLLALKLGWEQTMGPMPGSESAAGGPVLVDAHLYGAVTALTWMLAVAIFQKVRAARR